MSPLLLRTAYCSRAHLQSLAVSVQPEFCSLHLQYLVFEYVDKNLLEVLEEVPEGFSPEQVWFPLVSRLGVPCRAAQLTP